MKFKTNARCGGCKAAITEALTVLAPAESWHIDLNDVNKPLTYTGVSTVSADDVMRIVRELGFKIEPLE